MREKSLQHFSQGHVIDLLLNILCAFLKNFISLKIETWENQYNASHVHVITYRE